MHVIYLTLILPVIFVSSSLLPTGEAPQKEPIAHTRSPIAYRIEALQRAQSPQPIAVSERVEVISEPLVDTVYYEQEEMNILFLQPSKIDMETTPAWCYTDIPEKYLCLAQDLLKNLAYVWTPTVDRMVRKSTCPPHDTTYSWLWRCWSPKSEVVETHKGVELQGPKEVA